jgi:hypothetical protein
MSITGRSNSKLLLVVFLSGFFVVFSGFVFAADVSKEIETAVEHAGFAIKAKNAENTHLHLHHVVNCLVGSKGADFDASAGYPCKGQGNGVMNEVKKSSNEEAVLQQALTLAKTGTEITAYRPAHDVAMAVRDLLKTAAKDQAKQKTM